MTVNPHEANKSKSLRLDRVWVFKQVLLVLMGGFYLYFGIHLLVSAYTLDNPYTFILTFFASNFIILISAALLVGFIYRLVAMWRYFHK